MKGRPGWRLRYRPLSRAQWVGLLVLCLAVVRGVRSLREPVTIRFDSSEPHLVDRVIDGDTLLLEGGGRVRLLGVNTPETKHPNLPIDPLGIEAAEFTRQHVEGNHVQLQFDRERRDAYHRILAYVFVGDWFLNEQLILAGYSRAETRFPYSQAMKRRFRKAEQQARAQRRGLWAQLKDRD